MIQLQALNYILSTNNTSFITSNNLNEEFFSDYVQEFEYISNHIKNYDKVPDILTFLDKFPNFDVIQVTESPKYILDALFEDRNKRVIASIFNQIRNLLNDGKVNEALDLYATSSDIAIQAKHLDAVNIFKDTSRYDSYIEKCNDFSKYYISTGFKELDKIIGGWDRNEELATIVARSNVGKSWVLLKCALAAVEQGLRVGLYSGEMSANKVGYRLDTLISHISNVGITKGNGDLQNEYKRHIESLANKYDGDLLILTPDMIEGPAGVTALRAFIEKENLDMLCIDQHSLLEDDRKAKNPVEKASNISKDLKNLQVMKHIPIISVSQQNRESTENGVDLVHIAQSDRIGQDSTIVLFFQKMDNILSLHLVKSRDSENGAVINYAVDLNKGIFQYLPEDDYLNNNTEAQKQTQEEYNNEEEDSPF